MISPKELLLRMPSGKQTVLWTAEDVLNGETVLEPLGIQASEAPGVVAVHEKGLVASDIHALQPALPILERTIARAIEHERASKEWEATHCNCGTVITRASRYGIWECLICRTRHSVQRGAPYYNYYEAILPR
jgi:hypothetical protein